jgi:hypothetical protein
LNEAVRIAPNDVDAYVGRGFTWVAKRDFDKAIADFNEAIRIARKTPGHTGDGASRADTRRFVLIPKTRSLTTTGLGRCNISDIMARPWPTTTKRFALILHGDRHTSIVHSCSPLVPMASIATARRRLNRARKLWSSSKATTTAPPLKRWQPPMPRLAISTPPCAVKNGRLSIPRYATTPWPEGVSTCTRKRRPINSFREAIH